MTRSQLLAKRADHSTSHVLHLILSIITGGFWVPVWILVTIGHAIDRGKIDRELGSYE